MDVSVSIIDPKGTLVYYNRQAAKILDRKPKYIGTDIHTHHHPPANEKLDQMLEAFEKGRTEPFFYEARPYGKVIYVTLTPLIKNGEFLGCVQIVRLNREDAVPAK
jgi:PAS domain S-box-containing protein